MTTILQILPILVSIPHILAFVALTAAVFVFLNSGFIVGYLIVNWGTLGTKAGIVRRRSLVLLLQKVSAVRNIVKSLLQKLDDEYTHAREINIERCLNRLDQARTIVDGCPRMLPTKIRLDLQDLLGDLDNLRQDPSDESLYDLVQTKMNDLKFQFSRCLINNQASVDPTIVQSLEQEFAAANAAIRGAYSSTTSRI